LSVELPAVPNLNAEFSGIVVPGLGRASENDEALLAEIVCVSGDLDAIEIHPDPGVQKIAVIELEWGVNLLEPARLARIGKVCEALNVTENRPPVVDLGRSNPSWVLLDGSTG
jgi:hypothetical protein